MARSYITVVIAEPIVTIVLPQCTIATSQIVATYRCFMSQQTSLRLVMPLTWFRPVGLGVSRWSTFCWYHLNPPIQRWYGNLGSERWRYCFNKLSIQFVVWRVHHCIKSVVVLTSFPWRFCRMICKFSRSIVRSKQNGYISENYNSSWHNSSGDAPNVVSMPIAGIEPATYALRVRCSTNWAKSANLSLWSSTQKTCQKVPCFWRRLHLG